MLRIIFKNPNLFLKIEQNEENLSIQKTIGFINSPKGAILIEQDIIKSRVMLKEIGNIPLRQQIHNSCGPTSLAMVMDWLDKPYKDQEYYDKCVNRDENERTYIYQLEVCARKLGVDTNEEWNYDVDKLKTGDIVLYHYNNWTDLHFSVVDNIDKETIRLADPNNWYHEYGIEEFEKMYIGEVFVLCG